jgi:hypothetical protein
MGSLLVTVYLLSLGDYDAVTGIPARQYTPSSAKIVIQPKGSPQVVNFGYYPKTDAAGFTKYDVHEGDIIMDTYNSTAPNYWLVVARRAWTQGNQFVYYILDLMRMMTPSFHILSTNLQGFETISAMDKFEDNFERLYVTM